MSDPSRATFDAAFDVLRGQRPARPFAPAEAVRWRGRQRTVQQALVAGIVVFAVAGAGVGWAAGRLHAGPDRPRPGASAPAPPIPGPSGTGGIGTARPTPDPSDVGGLVLRPADLDGGPWQPITGAEPFEGPDRWHWANICPAYRSADYPSLHQQRTVQVVDYRSGKRYVHEHVHRYSPDWGPRALDDVRHVVATCAGPTTLPTGPNAVAPSRYTVVDTGFAGDESLLVREEQYFYTGNTIDPDPLTTLVAVVRVGDLTATVLPSPDYDLSAVRALAVKAADRLRSG